MNSQVLIDRKFLQDLKFLLEQPRTKIDAKYTLIYGVARALEAPAPIPDAGEGLEVVGYRCWFNKEPESIMVNWGESLPADLNTAATYEELCRHSEAIAGYAVRDARIAELEGEKGISAMLAAIKGEERDQLRTELVAIKAQEPAIARFEKHAMKAKDCLSECDVVLLSSIRRLLAASPAQGDSQ